MRLTDVRIKLSENAIAFAALPATEAAPAKAAPDGRQAAPLGRLRAFCALTFDNTFVIRDVKLIDGNDGLFLAMPSRKLADHCPRCREKNHLRARYCNQCGGRLDETRYLRYQDGNGGTRLKLHADIAHPINAVCRNAIEQEVINAYHREVERSRQPGYVPPVLDAEDIDLYDATSTGSEPPGLRLRPTGTM